MTTPEQPRVNDWEMSSYAWGMAGALGAIGPTPRASVLGMLRALHLTTNEGRAVIDYALSHHILVADGDELRAPRASSVY